MIHDFAVRMLISQEGNEEGALFFAHTQDGAHSSFLRDTCAVEMSAYVFQELVASRIVGRTVDLCTADILCEMTIHLLRPLPVAVMPHKDKNRMTFAGILVGQFRSMGFHSVPHLFLGNVEEFDDFHHEVAEMAVIGFHHILAFPLRCLRKHQMEVVANDVSAVVDAMNHEPCKPIADAIKAGER